MPNLPRTTRIAMWSGPRNISTALMRSFGSRPDTHVSDEPLYAHYLAATGLDHPHATDIMERHETNWRDVTAELAGPTPGGEAVWYQKHMAHHLLPVIDRAWLEGFAHALLVRKPRAMLASLVAKLGDARIEDTGLPQQVDIYRWIESETGQAPPVVDAADIQADPAGMVAKLCAVLGIEFDECMLAWETGPRPTDGCWGPYWYANTYLSTSFTAPVKSTNELDPKYDGLAEECEALYATLTANRIQTEATQP